MMNNLPRKSESHVCMGGRLGRHFAKMTSFVRTRDTKTATGLANVFVGHFWTFLDVFERFVRIFSTVFELFVHLFFVLLGFRTFSTEFRTSSP